MEFESYVRSVFQSLDNEYRPGLPPGNPVPINQSQFDALVSFAFNAGPVQLDYLVRGSINPIAGTEEGKFDSGRLTELLLGQYAEGGLLLNRRQQELDLFLYGVYP